MKTLFIGGDSDGRWLDVDPKNQTWRLPKKMPRAYGASVRIEAQLIEVETYRAMHFRGERRDFRLMVLDGMTADDVVVRLFAAYGQKAACSDACRGVLEYARSYGWFGPHDEALYACRKAIEGATA